MTIQGLGMAHKRTIVANIALQRSFWGLLIYSVLAFLIPQNIFIEALNGFFIGIMASIAIIFRKVFLNTLLHRGPYSRADQFALSIMYLWIALVILRLTSIWSHSVVPTTIIDQFNYMTTGLGMATAIAAGTMMITAPGWKEGYVHDEDRRTVIVSVIIGLITAFSIYFLQRYKIMMTVQEYVTYWWYIGF